MERTREMHVKEGLRRQGLLNGIMEKLDLAAIVCHANGAMAYQADVKFMTDLETPCGHIFSMMERGKQPVGIYGRPDSAFHARKRTFLDPENIIIAPDMMGEITNRINALGAGSRIGVPGLEEYPKFFVDVLNSTTATVVNIEEEFVVAKAPKSEYEIQLIQEASDLTIKSFEEVVKFISPEKTDRNVIAFAEGYLRDHGAEALLILTKVGYPHSFINRAYGKVIGPDEIFVYSAEIAGEYGYWTQIIRPIFMSKSKFKKTYDILCQIKEAINAGVEKFRPGNRICDISEAITKIANKYGLSEGIWAGHSMGIDLGDGYNIGISNKMEIVPNMILTYHPSLLDKDGESVLYADTYRSTEGDAVCMTAKYQDSPYLEDLRQIIK